MQIGTPRLILRGWRDADRPAFAAMSTDPDVMAHLSPLPTRAASDAWIDRQMAHMAEDGVCFWAVEEAASGTFVGSVGLLWVRYTAHFTPAAVEIGWRIAQPFWGRGYAPEAAQAALQFGFDDLQLPEIVAITSLHNIKSQRVMTKLGMSQDAADDFDHPALASGNPLRRQLLCRLSRNDWLARREKTKPP